jgi:hypothetical protein
MCVTCPSHLNTLNYYNINDVWPSTWILLLMQFSAPSVTPSPSGPKYSPQWKSVGSGVQKDPRRPRGVRVPWARWPQKVRILFFFFFFSFWDCISHWRQTAVFWIPVEVKSGRQIESRGPLTGYLRHWLSAYIRSASLLSLKHVDITAPAMTVLLETPQYIRALSQSGAFPFYLLPVLTSLSLCVCVCVCVFCIFSLFMVNFSNTQQLRNLQTRHHEHLSFLNSWMQVKIKEP